LGASAPFFLSTKPVPIGLGAHDVAASVRAARGNRDFSDLVKTAERILDTARQLFNAEGERNVTASDIAVELDMSPGNLYYHFKGKDSIHLALFSQLQRNLVSSLGTSITSPDLLADPDETPLQRSWLLLTVVLEQMLDYRYLYENPSDLMHRYPEIDRGFRRLVKLKRAACEAIAYALLESEGFDPRQQPPGGLIDAMTLALTYWLSYDQLIHPEDRNEVIVHRGVLQLLSFCAPYLGGESAAFYQDCERLYGLMVKP